MYPAVDIINSVSMCEAMFVPFSRLSRYVLMFLIFDKADEMGHEQVSRGHLSFSGMINKFVASCTIQENGMCAQRKL